jgi:acetyl esterase/lipase
MPSFQSYVFRAFIKVLSMPINSMASIPRLRAFIEKIPSLQRLPKESTIEKHKLDGIDVEWITLLGSELKSVILYLHGGAWVLGWYDNHRVLAAHIGRASRSRVLAVDYRLAPEHPYPAALDDCLTAYRWLLNDGINPKHIVIAGDSVGANLTLAVLLTLRNADEPLPAAAVCISPLTDLAFTGKGYYTQKDALLTLEFARSMSRHYVDNQDVHNPLISPQYADLRGLPPLLIHAGKDEILLNDAERLADKARHAGVDVTLTVWPKMWHVWHILAPYLPEAVQAINEIGSFARKHTVSKKEVAK